MGTSTFCDLLVECDQAHAVKIKCKNIHKYQENTKIRHKIFISLFKIVIQNIYSRDTQSDPAHGRALLSFIPRLLVMSHNNVADFNVFFGDNF